MTTTARKAPADPLPTHPPTDTQATPARRVAIVQSNYVPWKGYFDLIGAVDEFILFDNVQYTRRSWRNRNLIKTAQGPRWLTIPVEVKGKYEQRIRDTRIASPSWRRTHLHTLFHNYARAACFAEVKDMVESWYMTATHSFLSEVNHHFLTNILRFLGIRTPLTWSSDYRVEEGRVERLVSLCQQTRATEYLSGPTARAYMDEAPFQRSGITVRYIDYSNYPEYPQVHPPFEHAVSILDLVFNLGTNAARHLKGRSRILGP
ncbi:MAG: WbqC family protein [Myxococcota bacterium]